jgi:predicted alpha-1,6-mannanase (GH76 family)
VLQHLIKRLTLYNNDIRCETLKRALVSTQLKGHLMMRAFLTVLIAFALTGTVAASQQLADANDRVEQAFQSLMGSYDQQNGSWRGEGWWNDAVSVTMTADWAKASQSDYRAKDVLQTTFINAQREHVAGQPIHHDFLNKFYDDEGWWALAWIDAYDATHRPEYLATAKFIFADMQGGWDDTCGGGLWWNKKRVYKNAIANELFLSVAARLAQHSDGAARAMYLDWAQREWIWFRGSGLINHDNLINDGLTQTCENNRRQTWTYNQGVVLGGLVALSELENNPELIREANSIAHAALGRLTDSDGILHEPGGPGCGGDGVSFKGIFVRNLTTLALRSPDPAYDQFLMKNANAVWNKARAADGGFSCSWAGPPRDDGSAATTSAMAPLFGNMQVQAEEK